MEYKPSAKSILQECRRPVCHSCGARPDAPAGTVFLRFVPLIFLLLE
jgi:hypothetical protein